MFPKKINSILFDLDGTLVDSLRDIAEAMNAVLREGGYPVHPVPAYRRMVGDGMALLAQRALPAEIADQPDRVTACVRDMKQAYAGRWREHSAPYPGIPELLTACQHRGLRLGVLSNKPEPFTVDMVAACFPETPFATVRGAREGVPVKPHPAAALDILGEWATAPEAVLYVGDTDTDMKTGRAAGFLTVGVSWGFRDAAELTASGAHQVVDSPGELLALIDADGFRS